MSANNYIKVKYRDYEYHVNEVDMETGVEYGVGKSFTTLLEAIHEATERIQEGDIEYGIYFDLPKKGEQVFRKYLVLGFDRVAPNEGNPIYVKPVNIWVIAESGEAALKVAREALKKNEYEIREVQPLPDNKDFNTEALRQNERQTKALEGIEQLLTVFFAEKKDE